MKNQVHCLAVCAIGCAIFSTVAIISSGETAKTPAEAGEAPVQFILSGSSRDCDGEIDSNMANGMIRTDLNLIRNALKKANCDPLLFRDADTRAISTALTNVTKKKGVFFFYSGHGIFNPTTNKKNEFAGETQICLRENQNQDSYGVVLSSLFQNASPRWVVALVNSCFSGYSELKQLDFPYTIITSSEHTQSALGGVSAIRGTLVARAFASVVEGEPFFCDNGVIGEQNNFDTNCDGMLTDLELLEGMQHRLYRCANALAADYPLRLALRSNVSGQLPVVAYSHRGPVSMCSIEKTFSKIDALVSRLSDDFAKEKQDVQRLVTEHRQLSLWMSGKSPKGDNKDTRQQKVILPVEGRWDYFVMDEAKKDDRIFQLAMDSGLHPFPGSVDDATLFAKFTIGPRVYQLVVDKNERWLDIVSLRDSRLVRTITKDRGDEESVQVYHDIVSQVLFRLSHRVASVYEVIGDWYEVRFDGRIPSDRLNISLSDGKQLVFDKAAAISVPCVEEDGLCFRVRQN
ncbi:MAG: hypothetical protein JXR76_24430 [Deltaproteobacteria bacterium]|nr:hypothetical protein [Deltaproteobacteria bacterium]